MMKQILTILAFTLCYTVAHATLISPPKNMGKMVEATPVIVYGTITSANGSDNTFKITEVIKGDLSKGQRITVEEWGQEIDGNRTVISGDVDFRTGFNYLLFLSELPSGNYKTTLLSMSVFEEGILENQQVLGRNIAIQDIMFNTLDYDREGFRSNYKTSEFIPYLKSIANGITQWSIEEAGRFVSTQINDTIQHEHKGDNHGHFEEDALRAPCPNDAPCHCETLFGPAGPNQTKFASNVWTVCVSGGASDDPTRTTEITELQAAITAMNTMPGINISYTGIDATCDMTAWGAATSGSQAALNCAGGFGNDCNKVMVFFDDPFGEVPDVNPANCVGVLGIGGHFAGGTHMDACGTTWQTACNPYFVMNNFGACMAADLPSAYTYSGTLAHEMLHALGIGHHYGADAFTTTTAANNPCGAAGANNPAGAPTGDITHDQNECTGIMNPVVCNMNETNNAPNFGITALDNSCTDWMYNITSATTCAITNVTQNVAPSCSGNDQTFGICFDVTDGSGMYDIEVGGVTVQTSAGATDGNVCITVTVTGPAAGGTVQVNVRDDADFSCVDDTDLMVTLPSCPPDCANACVDAAASGCNVAVFPTNAPPTSYADIQGAGGESCTLTPVVAPGSLTQCFEYVHMDAMATSFFYLGGGSTTEVGDTDGIIECLATINTVEIFDMSGAGCAMPISTNGAVTNPVVGTTYIICVTFDVANDVGAEGTCQLDCIANSINPEMIMCTGVPDASLQQAIVCTGDDVVIEFGPGCMTDPTFDGLGAAMDGVSGWGILLYSDGAGGFTNFPPGLTGSDLLAGGDPNIIFFDVNAGGCANYTFTGGIIANTTCAPIDVPIGVLNMDVVNFFISSGSTECPVVEIGTVTIQPAPQAPTLDVTACVYTLDVACPGQDIITITGGASAGATITGDGTGSVTYTPAEGDVMTTLMFDISNGLMDEGGTACASASFTLDIDPFEMASITCPTGPFCEDDMTDYDVTAIPIPSVGEFGLADITINLTGHDFGGFCGDQIVVFDALGNVSFVYNLTDLDNSVIVVEDILVNSTVVPVGTLTVGSSVGTDPIDVAFFSGCGIGMQSLTCGFGGVDGSYTVTDSGMTVNGPFTPVGDGACGAGGLTTLENFMFNVAVTTIETLSSSGVFSGNGTNADTAADIGGTAALENDGETSFNPSAAGCGEHQIQYTFTDENGCASTDDCYIDVYCYPTLMAGTPMCNMDGSYNVDITVGNLSTGWNAVLDGTTMGPDGIIDGTITSLTLGTTGGTAASTMVTADGAVTISNVPMGMDITVSLTGNDGCDPMPVMITAPNCAMCPDLSGPAPGAIVSSESMCGVGCTVTGGQIDVPAAACPTGSTLQYSTDGGMNWSTMLPTYNPTMVVTVTTRCLCDLDMATASPTTVVATIPGVCTDPGDPTLTITDNVCPASTGMISATGAGGTLTYYTGPDAATAMSNATGDIGGSPSAPAYMAAPTVVFVCITETDANGCVSNPVCGMTTPVVCPPLNVSVSISDPCTCNNDSAVNDPHTFAEVVTIDGNPGDVWTITTSTGASGITSVETPAGSGDYVITFTHDDGVGYFMEVTNGTDILYTSNVCQYPDASFTVAGNYCDDDNTDYDLTTLVMENSTPVQPGVVLNVMVNGVPTTMFNPSTLGAGSYPILATYDGSGMGGNGTAGGNAADAYAGPTNLGQAVMPVDSDCLDEFVGTLTITTCPSCSGSNGTLTIKTVPGTN